eukprot:Nk52_evm1s2383 gene=Nk52_evmTU1s2383
MAILGAHLTITLITAFLLQRINHLWSLAHLHLRNLRFYMLPDNPTLKSYVSSTSPGGGAAAGGGGGSTKQRRKQEKGKTGATGAGGDFTLSRDVDIPLEYTPVKEGLLVGLQSYSDYEALVLLLWGMGISVLLTEIYETFLRMKEFDNQFNFSLIWVYLVLAFSVFIISKIMGDITRNGSELSIVLMATIFFFLFASVVLISEEDLFDFGLDAAYEAFMTNLRSFMHEKGFSAEELIPEWLSLTTFKIPIAMCSGIFAAFLIYPAMRFARCYMDFVRGLGTSEYNVFWRLGMHLNTYLPVVIVLLWINPISRYMLTPTYMSSCSFDQLRLAVLALAAFLRLFMFRMHMQMYFDIAVQRMNLFKKGKGRVSTNLLRRSISSVAVSVCVAASQYLSSALFLVALTVAYKIQGDFSWRPGQCADAAQDGDVVAMTVYSICDQVCYRGLLSYSIWWVSASWSFIVILFNAYYYYATDTANEAL